MRVSEILHEAADAIESRTWTRGNGWEWQAAGAPVCLEGGIAAAMGTVLVTTRPQGDAVLSVLQFRQDRYNVFAACPAYKAVQEYLGDRVPASLRGVRHLYLWNDNIARTQEEVVEVLRAAAEVEAAKEAAEAGVEVTA